MRENRPSGSEGGGTGYRTGPPYPYTLRRANVPRGQRRGQQPFGLALPTLQERGGVPLEKTSI